VASPCYQYVMVRSSQCALTDAWVAGSFLAMPLYEDMAPWNIFFEKDRLIYIDYDTRNLVFDEAVPMAYQVTRASLASYHVIYISYDTT
jgi:hypothetical protein